MRFCLPVHLDGDLLSFDLLSGELSSFDLLSGELLPVDLLSGELLSVDLSGELSSSEFLSEFLPLATQ